MIFHEYTLEQFWIVDHQYWSPAFICSERCPHVEDYVFKLQNKCYKCGNDVRAPGRSHRKDKVKNSVRAYKPMNINAFSELSLRLYWTMYAVVFKKIFL